MNPLPVGILSAFGLFFGVGSFTASQMAINRGLKSFSRSRTISAFVCVISAAALMWALEQEGVRGAQGVWSEGSAIVEHNDGSCAWESSAWKSDVHDSRTYQDTPFSFHYPKSGGVIDMKLLTGVVEGTRIDDVVISGHIYPGKRQAAMRRYIFGPCTPPQDILNEMRNNLSGISLVTGRSSPYFVSPEAGGNEEVNQWEFRKQATDAVIQRLVAEGLTITFNDYKIVYQK